MSLHLRLACGVASYLKSFGGDSLQRPVASAVVQLAAGASPGQRVGHAGAGDGVHEGRLPGTCTETWG